MPIRRGVVAASITELPTVTINAVTNFNQDRATFNATVSANYQSTTVKFQYNTTNNFASYTEVTATGSPVTGQSVAVYFNATGLSVGTTYYVRAVISNGIGTVTTSSVSFTTWSLKTVGWTSNSSITIPTITPTGGSAVVPSLYNIFVVGGGGGCTRGGGGGGQCSLVSSRAFNNTTSLTVSGTIGSGGTSATTSVLDATAGGSSSLTGSSFTTVTGAGGGAASGYNGGTSGSSNGGGSGVSYADPTPKSIAFTLAGGGGGGSGAVGGNGSVAGNAYAGTATGGNGGIGTLTQYGYYVGGGGGGGAANDGGAEFAGSAGAGGYGNGASSQAYNSPYDVFSYPNGSAGAIAFQYYGP